MSVENAMPMRKYAGNSFTTIDFILPATTYINKKIILSSKKF